MSTLKNLRSDEKWHILQLALVFNAVIGFGFLSSSLFINSVWGSGASFQAVFTALIHEAYCVYILMLVRNREIKHADFLGGIMVMMNIMLLQTAALWGDFSGGITFSSVATSGATTQLCVIPPGSAERTVTAFCTIILLVHIALSVLIIIWRDDLLPGHLYGGQHHDNYRNFNPEVKGSYHDTTSDPYLSTPTLSSTGQTGGIAGNRFVIDEDADAEL